MSSAKRHVWLAIAIAIAVTVLTVATREPWLHEQRIASARQVLQIIAARLGAFHQEHGRLPRDLDELPSRDWSEPVDYRVDGGEVVLVTFGADGKPGGLGDDADVYYPESRQPAVAGYEFFWTADCRVALVAGGMVGVWFGLCWLFLRWRTRPPFAPLLVRDVLVALPAIMLAIGAGLFVLMIQSTPTSH